MRNMSKIIGLILYLFCSIAVFAQTPGISYQAVISDPWVYQVPGKDIIINHLASTEIGMRFSIIDAGGTTEYMEVHTTQTNEFGEVNLIIGSGEVSSGNFSDILWDGNSKQLYVEIDYKRGLGYQHSNTQDLLYMPHPLNGSDGLAITSNTEMINAIKHATGLDAEGNYVANPLANYISAATSLSGADNSLDAAVKTNAEDLANIRNNQYITDLGLSGMILTIEIEGGASHTIDLSSLQGGIGTDDQTGREVRLEQVVDIDSDGSEEMTVEAAIIKLDRDLDSVSSVTTDNQQISLANEELSLTNGGASVLLRNYLNTDNQDAMAVYLSEPVDADGDGTPEATIEEALIALVTRLSKGCVDSLACNYFSIARDDDGSCEYADGICETCSGETDGTGTIVDNEADECGVCNGDGPAENADCDGNCLEDYTLVDGACVAEVPGCTDSAYPNHNLQANTDDGSCDMNSTVVFGCTDETAINYNVLANTDDGSCVAVVNGCTDETAFNYNVLANTDDGSCVAVVNGCTDESACNYDETANINDNSCTTLDCADECGGDAEEDQCGVCDNDVTNDCVQDCAGTWGGNLVDDQCGVCGGDNSSCADCAGVLNGNLWESDCGCVAVDNSGDECDDCAGTPNGDAEEDECGVCNGDGPAANADCDGNCLENFTLVNDACVPVEEGCTDNGSELNGAGVVNDLNSDGRAACNYNSSANTENDSCEHAPANTNCDGTTCLEGFILVNGACVPVVEDCTDFWACNFEPTANTDDGSCTYREPNADCEGNCLEDFTLDNGACVLQVGCKNDDYLEYDATALNHEASECVILIKEGCTYPNALNYEEEANTDDGSCYPIIYGCTDTLADNFNDFDNDGVKNEFMDDVHRDVNTDDGSCYILGCTFSDFINYNSAANRDDGSCSNDSDDVFACMDLVACNYNMNATGSDGSCEYAEGNCETCSGATDGTGTILPNDADSNGICDTVNPDDDNDNDTVLNGSDACREGVANWPSSTIANSDGVITDHDGDGCKDDTDEDLDDDNDGYSDEVEIRCGSNPLDETDTPTNTDGDEFLDCDDTDDDNDGVLNDSDDCRAGVANWTSSTTPVQEGGLATDNDGDGCKDDTDEDLDDDNDGYSDEDEIECGSLPLDASSIPTDTDGDGFPNCVDTDDDNDEYSDEVEIRCGSLHLVASSTPKDTDEDGFLDCDDTDDDNDGVLNDSDDCREGVSGWTSSTTLDHDGDGCKDYGTTTEEQGEDLDDDNDGYSDAHEDECGSDSLDASSTPPDTDGDKIPDCVDEDDDNDGVNDVDGNGDVLDKCAQGHINWNSENPANDYDGDGCKDDTDEDEDTDDDNDGVADVLDACTPHKGNAETNYENWTSVSKSDADANDDITDDNITDYDGDGCMDATEDADDDNDGVDDVDVAGNVLDKCAKGELNWTSRPIANSAGPATDHDSDGCMDATEDPDDDNDGVNDLGADGKLDNEDGSGVQDDDKCAKGVLNWTSVSKIDADADDNITDADVTDHDGDGCKDSSDCGL